MKLYKLLQAMDLRHSDDWDDYDHIEIVYADGEDCEVIPNTLRSILRFADCMIDSVSVELRNNNPIMSIIITDKIEGTPSIDLLRYKQHLCQ